MNEQADDLTLVGSSILGDQERENYSKRKRLYTFIVSNETRIVDLVLQAINECGRATTLQGVYLNFFEMTFFDVIDCFERVVKHVKEKLAHLQPEKLVMEMKTYLACLRLTARMSTENKETFLLKRGYTDLLEKYPFLDKDYDLKLFRELKRPQAFPNEIIDSYIYLGNGRHVV